MGLGNDVVAVLGVQDFGFPKRVSEKGSGCGGDVEE